MTRNLEIGCVGFLSVSQECQTIEIRCRGFLASLWLVSISILFICMFTYLILCYISSYLFIDGFYLYFSIYPIFVVYQFLPFMSLYILYGSSEMQEKLNS